MIGRTDGGTWNAPGDESRDVRKLVRAEQGVVAKPQAKDGRNLVMVGVV